MNDDELTGRIRAWTDHAATDEPAISADDVLTGTMPRPAAEEPIGRAGRPGDGPDGRIGRTGRARILAVAAAVLVLAGAVALATRDDREPGRLAVDPAPSAPDGTGDGRLVIDHRFNGPGEIDPDPIAIEGAVAVSEVRRDGELVATTPGWVWGLDAVLFDETVPTGDYEILTWVAICPASCGDVDADGNPTTAAVEALLPAPRADAEACRGTAQVTADGVAAVRVTASIDDASLPPCFVGSGAPITLVLRTDGLFDGQTEEGVLSRYVITGADSGAPVASGPIGSSGTILAIDRPLFVPEVRVEVTHVDCPAACPWTGGDGVPDGAAVEPIATSDCTATVSPTGLVAVVEIDETSCRVEPVADRDALPPLTEPPGWTDRRTPDRTCGRDITGPDAELRIDASDDVRRCFREAHQARRPMEIESAEVVDGEVRTVYWRTDRGRFQVVRPPTTPDGDWTVQNCDLHTVPEPLWARAGGCGVPSVAALTLSDA